MKTQELTMDRPVETLRTAATGQSETRTILFHIYEDSGLERRLEAVLGLARASGAHMECLHVTPTQAFTVPDTFGGVFTSSDILRGLEHDAAALRSRLEKKLSIEDVSWSYREITGDLLGQLVAHAGLADLLVTGRPKDFQLGYSTVGFLGDLLSDCRTALLILSDSLEQFDPQGPALIAWNGSYEAANAIRGSLGLLRLSQDVQLVQFAEETPGYFPSTRPLEYLSRHGIHAELHTGPDGNGDIAAGLVAYALANGMSYIVMGGYSHGRAGEFVFGGVTRELLKGCPISLVVAR